MPRFFLHVHNRIGFVRDEEGQELPDLDAAREAALASIRSIVADEATGGSIDLGGRIVVTGEDGVDLATLLFQEAFAIRFDQPA